MTPACATRKTSPTPAMNTLIGRQVLAVVYSGSPGIKCFHNQLISVYYAKQHHPTVLFSRSVCISKINECLKYALKKISVFFQSFYLSLLSSMCKCGHCIAAIKPKRQKTDNIETSTPSIQYKTPSLITKTYKIYHFNTDVLFLGRNFIIHKWI